MLGSADVVFYILATAAVVSAFLVIWLPNPVYSAFNLVVSMISIGGLFWSMGAFFVAAVQWAVYAGAVTVMFVMVLMLFDLKTEKSSFSKGVVAGAFKLTLISVILSVFGRVIYLYSELGSFSDTISQVLHLSTTRELSERLFTKYVFGFEAISVLLLMVVVGVVALSRSKGGTHAKS